MAMDDFKTLAGRPKLGCWQVHSETDSRWNKSGEAYGLYCTGGPPEMKNWIERCYERLGEPPADATMSFHKY